MVEKEEDGRRKKKGKMRSEIIQTSENFVCGSQN